MNGRNNWDGVYRLPELPYAFHALEPYINEDTMRFHYQHHAVFAENLNKMAGKEGFYRISAYELVRDSSKYTAEIRENAGGYINHKMFWRMLTPVQGSQPSLALNNAINRDFGSFNNFKKAFHDEARFVFGSGWAWLIVDHTGHLQVTATANHDNPIMDTARERGIPVLCLDVWEHAYYGQNQNSRSDYINSFWNIVDWKAVSRRFEQGMKRGIR